MSDILQLKLIEGEFSLEDGRDILSNIFSSKINFHQMKNFSSRERFGKDDPIAIKRIPHLKAELLELEKVLMEAKGKKCNLHIRSVIEITYASE